MTAGSMDQSAADSDAPTAKSASDASVESVPPPPPPPLLGSWGGALAGVVGGSSRRRGGASGPLQAIMGSFRCAVLGCNCDD
ncbi:unnamed protein product [Polarella glacialis]|uniref:Uncharacterized protein n=1 Tax=Polarella glacialis TaxID=89957 RepID=A0A813KTN2_POLGL|nr:unnamed protein product [Polarella glacialis]